MSSTNYSIAEVKHFHFLRGDVLVVVKPVGMHLTKNARVLLCERLTVVGTVASFNDRASPQYQGYVAVIIFEGDGKYRHSTTVPIRELLSAIDWNPRLQLGLSDYPFRAKVANTPAKSGFWLGRSIERFDNSEAALMHVRSLMIEQV